MMTAKRTEDPITQIMALLCNGASPNHIARTLNMHPAKLLRIMQRHGLMDLYHKVSHMKASNISMEPEMSTNFYFVKDQHKVHLGKRSAGWAFLFRGHKTVTNIREWYAQAQSLERMGYKLTNDNGDPAKTLKDLLIIIKGLIKGKQHNAHDGITYDENGNCFCDLEFS